MDITIIDNYDSFTYNLAHLVRALGAEVRVLRNDQFRIEQLADADKLLLSPGPGIPEEAGLLLEVIKAYAGKKPILGVCLGHQAIGEIFGAKLVNLSEVFHGVQTPAVIEREDYLFEGLPQQIMVGRYHSWVVDADCLPPQLEITARSKERQIMALRHKDYDIRGIQFHPESVLTPEGQKIISNWLAKR
ncbi:MAG: aminodeoxychorismate/anthranilate synthase component II [Bacteroidaceae bacterium]|nr:aminodeoxychorismate/anthranilate synthase component II [Bacteroidaceae bacterium]